MKRCPKCNLKYDDTLSFCLEDGTGLIGHKGADETLVLPSTQPQPTIAAMPFHAPAASPQPAPQRSSNRLLYAVILLLAIFAAGVTVALFYERDKPASNAQAQSTSPNTSQTQSPARPALSSPTPTPVENLQRYTVTSCGSINDARTSLEWFVGPDRNATWYDAQQWATGLQACGGGWRMPTLQEIQTLYQAGSNAGTGYYTRGQYWPAHMDAAFNAIGGGSWIWSDQQTGDGNARSFNMNQGKAVEYSAMNTTFSTRAFAVRRSRS